MGTMEDFTNLDNLDFVDNESWIPNHAVIQNQYKDGPFKPFVRMDKVGKYCDFSSTKFTLAAREDEAGFINVE